MYYDVEGEGLTNKVERDLTEEEADKILAFFKDPKNFHGTPSYAANHHMLYVIFALLFKGGLRRGEVVGSRDKRCNPPLPGLQVEDVRDGGAWVHGKGGYYAFQGLPSWVYDLLKEYIGERETGRIFDYDSGSLWYAIRRAAKAVGIADWENIHPHLTRHFFGSKVARMTGRDPWKVRDMLRHHGSSLTSTSRYVQKLDSDEKKEIAEAL